MKLLIAILVGVGIGYILSRLWRLAGQETIPCKVCHGVGSISMNAHLPPEFHATTTCPICKGRGWA